MSGPVIHVDKLSKQYRLGVIGGKRLVDDVNRQWARFRGKPDPLAKVGLHPHAETNGTNGNAPDEIWALKDVSFEVKQGEVLGIIGRNGAGKSTLLKILSRVTAPTSGEVRVKGRIASLLEVGTGFHPELTGRENIYLNGAIFGMTKPEIRKKFDEIVAFSEVDKFIDTPVKRYSSGMYVRLAFAVAAHLDPEILIVDEVLAVGDAQFQEKCIGKMNDISNKTGATVLFVSHNMASIQHLCKEAILMKGGQIEVAGDAREIVEKYLAGDHSAYEAPLEEWPDRHTTGEAVITDLEIFNKANVRTNVIFFGEDIRFRLHAKFRTPQVDPCFEVIIHDAMMEPLFHFRSIHDGCRLGKVDEPVVIDASLNSLGLYPGMYFLSLGVMDSACKRDLDFVKCCRKLEIAPSPGIHGDLKLDPTWGKYYLQSKWSRQAI